MNKRSLPSGLPTKPYIPQAPGPAPPLPAGPPPQQQQQQAYGQGQAPDQAAHAAAWAAYYQSQGVTAGAGYAAAPAGPQQPAAPVTANPYANYGYGAGAQHASAQYQQPAQPVAGPSQPYRPPLNTQAYATTATQPSLGGYAQTAYAGQQAQSYTPQSAGAGYRPPQIGQQQPRPPYQAQQPQAQQQGFAWGQQQAPVIPQQQQQQQQQPHQPYRPPAAQGHIQSYNAPQQQQAYFPQQPAHIPATTQIKPYRPSPTPQPQPQQQPYRPPVPQNQHRPPRPPIATATPTGPAAGFPPAKRPRFDGPGGGMNGHNNPSQIVMNSHSPIRPPTGPGSSGPGIVLPPVNAPGFAAGGHQPSFHVGSAAAGEAGRGGVPHSPARGGAPVPISRPPIHLGVGVPTGPAGFGRGGASVRGGMADRGGRGGRGMTNAPRGPSGMRRSDGRASVTPRRSDVRADRDKEKDKKRKEKELKTTMTDFRIVGIEIKALDWSWGRTSQDNEVEIQVKQEESDAEDEQKERANDAETERVEPEKNGTSDTAAVSEHAVEGETIVKPDDNVKVELAAETGDAGETSMETVEEKRGEKRKAKTPDADDEGLSKKRASNYTLTHNKPNVLNPSSQSQTQSTASSSDRFRIYFDSPPELDRIPKASRRNPNKRWRRESSSVAPSAVGGAEDVRDSAVTEVTQQEQERGQAQEQAQRIPGEADESVPEAIQNTQPTNQHAEGTPSAEVVGEESAFAVPENTIENSAPATEVQPSDTSANQAQSAVAPDLGFAISEDSIDQTTSAEIAELANSNEPEVGATVEDGENTGDMSMLTDPGAIAAAIDDIVEEVDAALSAEAGLAGDHGEGAQPPDVIVQQEAVAENNHTSSGEVTTNELPTVAESNAAVDDVEEVKATADAAAPNAVAGLKATTAGGNTPESAEEVAAALAASANNMASAYKSRARRHSSVSTTDSPQQQLVQQQYQDDVPTPSTNRISVLYEESSRRLCFDSDIVDKVKIWRKEGKIEVHFKAVLNDKENEDEEEGVEDDKKDDEVIRLPKGILIETYDTVDQRFVSLTRERLADVWSEDDDSKNDTSIPPIHLAPLTPSTTTSEVKSESDLETSTIVLTVFLNKKNPLSEPKWCRNNSADAWLLEQFGKTSSFASSEGEGWRGKLVIMDPDPAPTLRNLIESWSTSSSTNVGSTSSRKEFVTSLLASKNSEDILEVLLRLTRNERERIPTSSSSTNSTGYTASTIAELPASSYASYQTHISLAILAMYRLTTSYAKQAGETEEALDEKVHDIIKTLPGSMINKSLDGMFREWQANKQQKQSDRK